MTLSKAGRAGRLALALLLLGTPAAEAEARLPEWLLGTWALVDVHQEIDGVYRPEGGPKAWWRNRAMTVAPGQITFAAHACVVGGVQARQGRLADLVRQGTGDRPDELGLPPERGQLEYLSVRCARSLAGLLSGNEAMADTGVASTWLVVVRSHDEVEMPFLSGSYLRFRKTAGP